jgi:predicted transcriptional regulator
MRSLESLFVVKMEQSQISGSRIKLPSGKDAGLVDILSFCYGLSETDVQVLMALMKGDARGTEELESDLKLSKASINRSLNKLLEMALVMRIKEPGNKAGRPRYLYKAKDYNELKSKILQDIKDCSDKMASLVESEFKP